MNGGLQNLITIQTESNYNLRTANNLSGIQTIFSTQIVSNCSSCGYTLVPASKLVSKILTQSK